ncbi:hypothetical protein SeLEV6574_g06629 [Synchytrium endobioticum]|uniref:Uncharacterized protein n=1 Tax=Synchytrium endobioticum TaxID=286115 RepID=A0A507CKU2_9FUNG|nr:hypothetical protein SeLEV6574_g06629 [Synchytrium endobioticum]
MSHIVNSAGPFHKYRTMISLLLVIAIASSVLTAPTPMDPRGQNRPKVSNQPHEDVSGHTPNSLEPSNAELGGEKGIIWPPDDVFHRYNAQGKIECPSDDVFY